MMMIMMLFPFFFMSDSLGSVMKRKLRNRRQFGRNIGTGLGLKETEHLMDRLADGSHAHHARAFLKKTSKIC